MFYAYMYYTSVFFLLFVQYFIQMEYHILSCTLFSFRCLKTSQPGFPTTVRTKSYLLSMVFKPLHNLALSSFSSLIPGHINTRTVL